MVTDGSFSREILGKRLKNPLEEIPMNILKTFLKQSLKGVLKEQHGAITKGI